MYLRHDYYSQSKIIFIGDSMKIFNGILRDKRKSTKKIVRMSDYDDSVMFLDKSHYGPAQLKYFISERKREERKKNTYDSFGAKDPGRFTAYIPGKKTDVSDCTTCHPYGIYLLKSLSRGLRPDIDNLYVVCFDFQLACIKKYLGDADNITYYTYDSEKVLGMEDSR